MLKLHDYWRSSAAYRVRIGLNLKGVPHESTPVNIAPGKDEHLGGVFRDLNPQARVPVLETGAGVLVQSLAILEFLDESFPDPPFLPGDAAQRALIRAFSLAIVCDIHPLNNVGPLNRLRSQFGADDAGVATWIAHWITRGFDALEIELGRRPQSAFCFGEAPSLADICLVPQMYSARRFKLDSAAWPRLAAIDERARAHTAFAGAAPEKQKDAVAT